MTIETKKLVISEELKRKSKYIAPSNDENPIEFIVNWIKELKNK